MSLEMGLETAMKKRQNGGFRDVVVVPQRSEYP